MEYFDSLVKIMEGVTGQPTLVVIATMMLFIGAVWYTRQKRRIRDDRATRRREEDKTLDQSELENKDVEHDNSVRDRLRNR